MDNSVDSDLIRGNIDTIILNALCDKDRYGLEIIDEIEKRSHGSYQIKQPTLYSALTRLEKLGYVIKYSGDSPLGAKRAYFSITDLGRDFLKKNREEWAYSRVVIEQLISNEPIQNNKEFAEKISEAENSAKISNEADNLPKDVQAESESVPQPAENDNNAGAEHVYVPDSQLFAENIRPENSSLYDFIKQPSNPSNVINGQSIDEIILGSITSNAPISVTADSIIAEGLKEKEEKIVEKKQEEYVAPDYVDYIGNILSSPVPQVPVEETSIKQKPQEPIREQLSMEFDFDKELADTRPVQPIVQESEPGSSMQSFITSSSNEHIKLVPIKPRQFMNFDELEESISASGDTLIVRKYNPNTEKEYNDKFYVYSNKMNLVFYSILFGLMLLEIFVPFLILQVFTKISTIPGNLPVLIITIIFAGALPFYHTYRYLKDPFRRTRYYQDKTSSLIMKFSIFALLLIIIYGLNVIFRMSPAFQPEYLFTIITPALLATNIPISSFIFDALYNSRKFAVD